MEDVLSTKVDCLCGRCDRLPIEIQRMTEL